MKSAIRYYTRTGNAKKLADALFLSSSVYAAGVDLAIRGFIGGIGVKAGRVVNFSTVHCGPLLITGKKAGRGERNRDVGKRIPLSRRFPADASGKAG